MSLRLYGHDFSSYTWKAKIALYANGNDFEMMPVRSGDDDNDAFVQAAHPFGKFPVLRDGEKTVIESSAIIEYLAAIYDGAPLISADPYEAARARMMDRVFDRYVMDSAQFVVDAYIADADHPDPTEIEKGHRGLERAYDWLELWLADNAMPDHVSIATCAAAPALFYADWVLQIGEKRPRLNALRAEVLALDPVSRCVEEARPYREYFPSGAPDRD